MGGGSGGSGGVIRGVQRAIRGGVGGAPSETFSNASTTAISKANSRNAKQFYKLQTISSNTALTLSSSSSNGNHINGTQSLINFPVSAASGAYAPSWESASSESSDWEYIDGIEDGKARVLHEDELVFGTAPTTVEVEQAVSALQQAMAWSPKSKFSEDTDEGVNGADWVEPSPYLSCNSRQLQPHGVLDAFHLLQTEPSIQRMVVSISSDRAVWDAILNNEVVKDLKGSIFQADELQDVDEEESKDNPSPFKDILSWVTDHAKAKIVQLVDKIATMLNLIFQLPNKDGKKGEGANSFEEKLKTSLMLSVVVLLIVVVTRLRGNLST